MEITNIPLIQSFLSDLFDAHKNRLVPTPLERSYFDFIIRGDSGFRTAVEVTGFESINIWNRILEGLSRISDLQAIIIVVPDTDALNLGEAFLTKSPLNVKCKVSTIDSFLQSYNIRITSLKDFYEFRRELTRITLKEDIANESIVANSNFVKKLNLSEELLPFALNRQFSNFWVDRLRNQAGNVEDVLHIGKNYRDAIIVLTDIRNFSKIVEKADPEDLRIAMDRYYEQARDLTFSYGGVLDKFIGDSVLAFFNFPEYSNDSYQNALRFSAELIEMGRELFGRLAQNFNEVLETGTRVGINSGRIYVLNIGKEHLEVSFLGKSINQTAVLENKCAVDNILVSNTFYNKVKEVWPSGLVFKESVYQDKSGVELIAYYLGDSEVSKLISVLP